MPDPQAPGAVVQGSLNGVKPRRRLLILTPYSPKTLHGHAADDLGKHLVETLSEEFDLHVYAPDQVESSSSTVAGGLITYHAGSAPRPSFSRHLGVFPAGLRKDWSRDNTREAMAVLDRVGPDLVHVEYLQPVEALRRQTSLPWSLTLHDITSRVFAQRAARSKGVERPYRWIEHLRALHLEKAVVRKANRIFTLSSRDASWVRSKSPDRSVTHVKIGIEISEEPWSAGDCDSSVFVFAGAMWRDSNSAVAVYLAHEVMPLVWKTLPKAVLRIVGARPSPVVVELGQDPRIQIVGLVPSIESEYLGAVAVLAPTLVDAGVLLKALRALACGSPLILNSAAADPLEVTDDVHCYIRDTPESFAEKMIQISRDPQMAEELAASGRGFVRTEFSWRRYGQIMTSGIGG
ncbi:glycosyltransferase family 4 protein [Arthrobacter sp. AL12]|uniref:glycosyltransferase family 4 protein n=1 Tax=Arthrobacter sp. AL12 TaxID=3042241 RepID=UPI00249A921D|nr:glycosyltransferase family 4 protein [Arthrobacter sp. AL12]MDI3213090.1 glycosyltransferase family 4 protein [Arthrobacter sp. AL12]